MQVVTVTVAMLVCLQVKHFIADYLMQPKWILMGKRSLRSGGGYVHAAVHAVGSIPADRVRRLTCARFAGCPRGWRAPVCGQAGLEL